MAEKRRVSRDERREQILQVALNTVARQGVRGATLTSIAAGVGITYPALYAHFPTRRHLLIALIDRLFEGIQEMHARAYRDDAVEHLREIGLGHSRLVASAETGCVLPFFEFVAAAPEENLREAFGERELAIVDEVAEVVRRGQRQGTIKSEADPEQVAWMIMGRGWTEDVAALMALSAHWTPERSRRMLDWILGEVAASASRGEAAEAG
jgi:AcrR family transcriptional regulator